jgi:formate hydrogenlyase subunit 3/multisubunit Na+/H+ antiporter MnhD subunit
VVLMVINWIWTDDAIQVGTFGFAALVTYITGALFFASRREAIRRGPPPHRAVREGVPSASLSAALIGLSAACILFGVAWSKFLIYFGAGVLLLSAGRMALELRAERETHRSTDPGAKK